MKRGIRLAFVVRVDVSGGTLHLDHIHAHAGAQSVDDIHGRDDRRTDAIFLADVVDRARLAAAPGPDGVGFAPLQELRGLVHQFAQCGGSIGSSRRLCGGKMFRDRVAVIVVRLVAIDIRAVLVARKNQQVSVADAWIETNRRGAQFFIQQGNGVNRILLRNVSA